MERLQLRNPKPYGERTKQEKKRKKLFFIVGEGETEETYFQGVKSYRRILKISNTIHIEVLERAYGEQGKSHPKQLVVAALENMGRIDKEGREIPEDKWDIEKEWEYDSKLDEVWLIFDRDYRNLEKEMSWIYENCQKYGINIGFSNPNFELWLLMHFEGIEQYNKELLLHNPKNLNGKYFSEASKQKKYLEIILSQKAGGYKKGKKVNFETFVHKVYMAIEQEKFFCEDEEKIFYELGSNVGILIQRMKS